MAAGAATAYDPAHDAGEVLPDPGEEPGHERRRARRLSRSIASAHAHVVRPGCCRCCIRTLTASSGAPRMVEAKPAAVPAMSSSGMLDMDCVFAAATRSAYDEQFDDAQRRE